jgi:arylsulfatase
MRRDRPDIVLITIDTLRADHLGSYGYPRDTSPNIDRFAQDSLVFENCLSHASETCASLASLFTGFLPHETKALLDCYLPPAVDTLAEILRSQGYKTAAVVSNFALRKKQGFEQGFLIYDDTMDERERVRRFPERTAAKTTARAIELLKQFHQDRLFLWIHYQDPHGPYTPPAAFRRFHDRAQTPHYLRVNPVPSGRGGIPFYQRLGENQDFHYYVSQYDGEIRYLDAHFHFLIEALREYGLYDDALIVFSADHGESLGEYNYFFSHGENLYNSETRVPLMVKFGGRLSGRRTEYVQHLDIVPTILRLLGIEPDSRLRGRDLLTQHRTSDEIAGMTDLRSRFSLVHDGFRLIHSTESDRYELFDLRDARREKANLMSDPRHRDRAADLKARLARIRHQDLLNLGDVKPPELTPEEREHLRAMGYLP